MVTRKSRAKARVRKPVMKKPVPEPPKKEEKLEAKPDVQEQTNDIIPVSDPREAFSLDETAQFLGVSLICARLWFNHGHLSGTDEKGFVRVSRASILSCHERFLVEKR